MEVGSRPIGRAVWFGLQNGSSRSRDVEIRPENRDWIRDLHPKSEDSTPVTKPELDQQDQKFRSELVPRRTSCSAWATEVGEGACRDENAPPRPLPSFTRWGQPPVAVACPNGRCWQTRRSAEPCRVSWCALWIFRVACFCPGDILGSPASKFAGPFFCRFLHFCISCGVLNWGK